MSPKGRRRCGRPGRRISRYIIPALLLFLNQKVSHGYELMEKLSELGLADGPADPGAVYRALRTLEEDGFVTSEWKTQERGPARRVYHLTKLGEKLLEEWVKELKKRRDALDNIIALYEKADKEISD